MSNTNSASHLLPRAYSIYQQLIVPVASGISLGVLALIIGTGLIVVYHPDNGIRWIPTSGKIYAVVANSPAAAAGVQPMDRIIAVDNIPMPGAFYGYATQLAGASARLSIVRNDQILQFTTPFVAPRLSVQLRRLAPLLVALCFAGFSFFVWARKPYDLTVLLFLVFSQLGAATLALGLLSVLVRAWFALWFDLSFMLLSTALIHFHLRFPRPQIVSFERAITISLYITALLLAPLRWISAHYQLDIAWISLFSRVGPLYFVIAILAVMLLLIRAYHIMAIPSDRRRIRLVMTGTALAYAPIVGLTILPDIIYDVPIITHEIAYLALITIPISYAIAIHRFNLLRIDRLVNRGVVHLTVLLAVALIYLALMGGLPMIWPMLWAKQPLLGGLITMLIAALLIPLHNRVQAAADRLFYGGWYNYRSLVSEMSWALNGIIDADALGNVLVRRLAEILRLRAAVLLLPADKTTLAAVAAIGMPEETISAVHMPATGLIAQTLLEIRRPLHARTLRAMLLGAPLTTEEWIWLSQPAIDLWAPLVRHERIQGILLLGARVWDEPFDAEDRRMLNVLAWQAAIAAENVQLVSALRRRADEIRRLYSQLVRTREDERKHLARELHDQAIQDLIRLHYLIAQMSAHDQAPMLQRQLQAAIDSLRRICTDLRPAALDDLNLSLAVQGYIEELGVIDSVNIVLQLEGDPTLADRLPEDIALSLFRVIQETMANIRRHARASQVNIILTFATDSVSLEICDDGQGFFCPTDMGKLIRAGHFGLAGLQERMSLIDGALQIESAPGRGTIVRAQAPLERLQRLVDRLADQPLIDRV